MNISSSSDKYVCLALGVLSGSIGLIKFLWSGIAPLKIVVIFSDNWSAFSTSSSGKLALENLLIKAAFSGVIVGISIGIDGFLNSEGISSPLI